MCKEKGDLPYKNIVITLSKSSDTQVFWQATNDLKKKNSRIMENITPTEWVSHFKYLIKTDIFEI